MRWSIALVLAYFLFSSQVAYAGIDVAPDPDNPGVKIDGRKSRLSDKPGDGSGKPSKDNSGSTRSEGDDEIGTDDARFQQYDGLTWGDVRSAVRRLPFPVLTARTQPGAETLVNIDTIFFADAPTYSGSVTLLGYAVDVRATPTRFRWLHGDGTSQTTSDPGGKHPNETVTHKYRKAVRDLSIRVDVTYTVQFRIDGGTWQGLGETITASGNEQQLTIRQATALLH